MREVGRQLSLLPIPIQRPLGLAFADGVDALQHGYRDNRSDAHVFTLAAAEQMAGIPCVFPAARLRLKAAQLLAADGRHADAPHQLRLAHGVFHRMGAARELRIARERMRWTRGGRWWTWCGKLGVPE